jgi:16S rRNA (cytidine1402-2'-O)-methyltransferase
MSEFFVVATPIGNLSDISLRALDVIKNCDVILCEDTRITNRLLLKYDIKNKKLVLYNDNSDEKTRQNILKALKNGSNIALVSDAGTPLISDPGHKLISFLRKNAIKITPIPGASSLIAAISACGLAADNFIFLGFLPNTSQKRRNMLKNVPKNFTFAFFESPNRVLECLNDVFAIFGDVKACAARELTKIHEEILTDDLSNLIKYFSENEGKQRGEFVIIVEKTAKNDEISHENLKIQAQKLLKSGLSLKDVATNLAEIHNLNKKEVYNLILKLSPSDA